MNGIGVVAEGNADGSESNRVEEGGNEGDGGGESLVAEADATLGDGQVKEGKGDWGEIGDIAGE
jgi:hypothetical protein